MAAGFKCYADDAANSLLVDMTTTFSQITGYFDIAAGSSGYFDAPLPPTGRQFFYVRVPLGANSDGKAVPPGISADNLGGVYRISWNYGSYGGWGTYPQAQRIHYGYV